MLLALIMGSGSAVLPKTLTPTERNCMADAAFLTLLVTTQAGMFFVREQGLVAAYPTTKLKPLARDLACK